MNRFNIVRYTAFSLEILICSVIQSVPGLSPEVFGGRPVLLLPLAVSIAIFEGEVPAIVFGVISGLLADAGYSGPMGYYSIMLAVLCFIVSVLMENYIKTNLLTAMLIGTISIPVIIFVQFLLFYVSMGYGDVWVYFAAHYISRIIYTWAFVPVFYGINRFIAARTMAE
ncbi:MAG: rod shape-determining protein MreD [Clostridia bacterium]|nr:rod shape-determining protein MreD [Clostridia bacterium]